MELTKNTQIDPLFRRFNSSRNGEIIPNDPASFPRNQEVYNVLTLRVNRKTFMIQKCRNLLEAAERLQAQVALELSRLKT